MRFALLADKVFTPNGVEHATAVIVNGDTIEAVTKQIPSDCECIRLEDLSLMAGFVDIHIHGRAGCDVMDATPEALQTISDALPETGVVAWCGTTVTAPMDEIHAALSGVNDFIAQGQTSGAELVGSFLEGPYFTEPFRGSHPARFLKAATLDELEQLSSCAGDSLLRVALAPEYDGSMAVIDWLVARGIKVSVAHTSATFDQVTEAHQHGADCGVHLFNGMLGLHHREPGCAGAVLYHDMLAEIIPDGVHVNPVMMNLAHRMKGYEKMVLITDCMRAGGMPDGDYVLGAQTVTVTDGNAITQDGSLAGSTCSLDKALRTMVFDAKIPLWEAVQMSTAVPARYLGLEQRLGSIAAGFDASLVVMDDQLHVHRTLIKGQWAFHSQE